jgi:hypothetical protein
MAPLFGVEEARDHAPEPWRRDGCYVRDANGEIVVRGRTAADARRIVASVNATRGIPTDALERWFVQDVSDPVTRPDLEIDLESNAEHSPHEIRPDDRRRLGDRRRGERRRSGPADPSSYVIDRRVFERRRGERRRSAEIKV